MLETPARETIRIQSLDMLRRWPWTTKMKIVLDWRKMRIEWAKGARRIKIGSHTNRLLVVMQQRHYVVLFQLLAPLQKVEFYHEGKSCDLGP